MIQIRSGVFETNSSSTHSLTIEGYKRWQSGLCLFDDRRCNFTASLNSKEYLQQYPTSSENDLYTFTAYINKFALPMFASFVDAEMMEEDDGYDEDIENWFKEDN